MAHVFIINCLDWGGVRRSYTAEYEGWRRCCTGFYKNICKDNMEVFIF